MNMKTTHHRTRKPFVPREPWDINDHACPRAVKRSTHRAERRALKRELNRESYEE